MRKPKAVLCGTKWGYMYLKALTSPGSPFELAGILAKGSSRSQAYADGLQVPLYRSAEELPGDIDLACVVIKSTVIGGEGTDIALQLISRGIHVIQEHPVHPDDIGRCMAAAENRGVIYHVNSHYRNIEPVNTFIDYLTEARRHAAPLFVEATASIQLLYSLLDIIGKSLGGFRPYGLAEAGVWHEDLTEICTGSMVPFQSIQAVLAGVPTTLKIHNCYDPEDMDNHFFIMHRVCVGMPSGNLTLVNTHGPVVWSGQFYIPGYGEHDATVSLEERDRVFTSSTAATAVSLSPQTAPSVNDIATRYWPWGICRALETIRRQMTDRSVPFDQSLEYLTDLSSLWIGIMNRIGEPGQVVMPVPDPPVPDLEGYRNRMMEPCV